MACARAREWLWPRTGLDVAQKSEPDFLRTEEYLNHPPTPQKYPPMSAFRMLFLIVAAMITIGIGLTGYRNVHWFLYVPAVATLSAGLTGFCPGLILLKKLGFKG